MGLYSSAYAKHTPLQHSNEIDSCVCVCFVCVVLSPFLLSAKWYYIMECNLPVKWAENIHCIRPMCPVLWVVLGVIGVYASNIPTTHTHRYYTQMLSLHTISRMISKKKNMHNILLLCEGWILVAVTRIDKTCVNGKVSLTQSITCQPKSLHCVWTMCRRFVRYV